MITARPVPRSRAMRTALSWAGDLLATAGLFVIGFACWQLFWTPVIAQAEQEQVLTELTDRFETVSASLPAVPPEPRWLPIPTGVKQPVKPAAEPTVAPNEPRDFPQEYEPGGYGDPFAIIRIPAFGADYAVPVAEGTNHEVLSRGIGHDIGTVLPGELGNFGVAGHRTTYGKPFNRIAELENGDEIVVETPGAWITYRVTGHDIVTPTSVEVYEPVPYDQAATPEESVMTLVACHPMFSAAQRYVVFAELVLVQEKGNL